VQRNGSTYGVLRAIVTMAHSDFYSYAPSGSTWGDGAEDVDGALQMVSYSGNTHLFVFDGFGCAESDRALTSLFVIPMVIDSAVAAVAS